MTKKKLSQEKLWEYGRKIPSLPKGLPGPLLAPTSEFIAKKNYFLVDLSGKIIETSKQMFWRVAHNVATADLLYGSKVEVKKTRDEFYRLLINLEFVPNTPTFANAGANLQQLSACFVLPIEDDLQKIGQSLVDTIMIHKSGGGTGFSFSHLRPFGSRIRSTGRVSSGAIYFMWMYADATDRIQQGGYRRGANMGVMNIDHPDILRWIMIKSSEFTVTSFNLSVALTDKFMQQVEKDTQFAPEGLSPYKEQIDKLIIAIQKSLQTPASFGDKMNDFEKNIQKLKEFLIAKEPDEGYDLVNPDTKKSEGKLNAKKVFELIGRVAWEKGDPGVIFIDRLDADNPTPLLGKIESTNPCVVGSTLVATEKGLIPIKELVEKKMELKILTDNRVLGSDGVTLRPHNHLWDNGVKEVWRLETKSGFELLATPDHKIMTSRGWVPLSKLQSNKDKVLIQGGEGIFNQNENLPFTSHHLPSKWSIQLGQVLGWLVGDGWLRSSDKNCRVGFTFGEKDKKILDYFQPILNQWYDGEIKAVKRVNGVWHLSYHSQYLVEFFEKLGVKSVKANEKEVPNSLFTAPEEVVIGFLQGLFSADGTIGIQEINNSKYIRLTAKSKKLLQQVQLLLLNLGIVSRIYDRSRPPRKIFPYITKKGQKRIYLSDGVCFELHLGKTAVPLFLNKIGFLKDKHYQKVGRLKKMGFYPQIFADTVAKLESAGKTRVYDLTEQISSSFIANGMVISNCGEQPLLPYESCNLGAINLSRMVKKSSGEFGEIDYDKIRMTIQKAVHFLDNVIDMNHYPLPQIEQMTKKNRKIGLGVMGWADMLVQLGISYDSSEALETAAKLMNFIREEARKVSVELARKRGIFPNFKGSIYDKKSPHFKGRHLRLRNATLTTIAPTGTTSMLADASSGIEPYFAVIYEKNMVTGERVTNLNPYFVKIAKKEGFWADDLAEKIKANKGSVKDLKEVPLKFQKLFSVAADLSYESHIKMQAAFQNSGVDNAVSKTINMSLEVTPQDVIQSYLLAYTEGCKGVTIYRDRSRQKQILERDEEFQGDKKIYLRRLPEIRHGGTWGLTTPVGTLHATINEDELGHPLEVFFNVGKAGGDILAVAEGLGRLISFDLRTTPPKLASQKLGMIADQLSGIGGSSSVGFGLKKIRSLPDAIAKILQNYLREKSGFKEEEGDELPAKDSSYQEKLPLANHNGNICPQCGNATLAYEEGCEKCICGYSKC